MEGLCLKAALVTTTSIRSATPTNFIAGPLAGIIKKTLTNGN